MQAQLPVRTAPGIVTPRARLAPLAAVALLAAALAAASSPAAAQTTCDRSGCGFLNNQCGGTPAHPVPQALWGNLQPADSDPVAAERDGTSFNDIGGNYFTANIFADVAATNTGYLYVTQVWRFQVWDPRANPAKPASISKNTGLGNGLDFGTWPHVATGESAKTPGNTVAVPADTDTVAAVGADFTMGIGIVNVTDKVNPALLYQGFGPSTSSLYATTIGGTHYVFLGADGPVRAFNMDRAAQLASPPCSEDLATQAGQVCPGVYVGKVGSSTGSSPYVHGAGNLIATATGNAFPGGVQVYDVSSPASAQLRTTVLTGTAVYGVAMWQDSAGHSWLAARTVDANNVAGLAILDVSCAATSACLQAPQPTFTGTFNEPLLQRLFLTFTRDGSGRPYIYTGSDNQCGSPTTQREWLFDVSNPAAPVDVTPAPQVYNGNLTGYWGWYYRANPTGFNRIDPRHGAFIGNYFYRAAWFLFDVHKLTTNSPPVAAFTYSPAQIYPGTPVTFTDASTGNPQHTTDWTFQPDGSPATAQGASVPVSFPSKGAKTVTLTDQKGAPTQTISTQNITVLDPLPAVQSVTVSPASPLQCQTVTLTANATGQPALTYSWTVVNGSGSTVAAGSTNPLSWATGNTTPASPPSYTAKVTVSNGAGSFNFSQPITLGALANLPGGGFTITNDPFTAGAVNFHASAADSTHGATQWYWDFGDGTNTGWLTDPVAGPSPTHVYQAVGSYNVTLQVKNCLAGPVTSATLPVHILVTTPLKAGFRFGNGASCFFPTVCSTVQGTNVDVIDSSTGASFWDYDWDGSGTFADAGHSTPVTSHLFNTPGTFVVKLRVRRGTSEVDTFSVTMAVSSPNPPSVSIIGPGQGTVNSPLSFAASAANCSPAATWTWNASGGTISGDPTAAAIVVTWPSAGNYSITVTNSGCAGVQGTAFVAISGGSSGGGGPLIAQFTFQPATPKAGDTVSFDASSSTGNPQTWVWNFGDGASANGAQATHVFSTAATFTVTLTETAPGSGAGCVGGLCASQAVQSVVVASNGPPPPPPLNPAYSANAQCVNQFGFNQCTANTGQTVTLTAAENRTGLGIVYAWDFGDGGTASAPSVQHAWSQPGSYPVKLALSAPGFANQSATVTFLVNGPPPPPPIPTQSLMLPWIASSRGALAQSSDLYILNPDAGPVDVTLTFLKRGLPEASPPQVTQTLQPGQTLYAPNVLSGTFNRENVAGFITVTAKTKTAPILTAFNTTQSNGVQFGQTVGGIALPQQASADAPVPPTVQELVGLSDNADQFSYFGVSNPNPTNSTYRLHFFDATGAQLADSGGDVLLGSFGQRQYQVRDIRSLFKVSNTSDYRIEVETTSGGQVYPFAANVRFASQAPAFVGQGQSSAAKLYLLGVSSSAGNWQSDALLANTGSQAATSTLTYTRFGVGSQPSAAKTVTVQAGETHRLANVVGSQFGLANSTGVLTVESTSGGSGLYPLLRGETFNLTVPANQYGQGVPAFSDDEAAGANQSHYLVGLRQDAGNKTTVWLFNPGPDVAFCDIVYRALDGSVIQTVSGVATPPGHLRQYLPRQLPLPAAGVADGFTVQINVQGGTLLAAAQVVNTTSGAPAYVKGVTR